MANVSIVVKNKSDEVQQFLIFCDQPGFSENTGKAWTNVWGRSPGVGAVNGNTKFGIRETYFAVCGMEKTELASDLTVQTSDYQPVKLGTDKEQATKALLEIDDGGAVFEKNKSTLFQKNGAFGIQSTAYDLTQYKHAFCGIGMKSPIPQDGEVVPVAVWQAKPNQQYQITPKRTYYISTGKYKAGRIVNVAELGTIATIDFTGRKETRATVEFTNELSYGVVEYSFDQDEGGDE